MKLTSFLVGTAHAQLGGGNPVSTGGSKFSITDFTFLNPAKDTNLNSLVGTIIGLVLTVAALVAFFYLIVAGFQYITAGGDSAKATTARTGIVNALIGIVVILVAYVVLHYVGTQIVPSA